MTNHYSALDNLPADYEALLGLIRERDQLLLEYVAALSLSDEQYSVWNRNAWKKYARNHLALIQAVRPVTYTDYRHRIRILSPTFGIDLPHLKATGWMLDSEAELRREAESSALLASFVEEEIPAELLPLPTAGAVSLPALPLFVEPETLELEPLPPVIVEPLISIEEFHAAPAFEGIFLAPTATKQEVTRLLDGLFIANEKVNQAEENTSMAELYQRTRALLLDRYTAPSSAAPSGEADRLAAIEIRKRNRAKLQANRPELVSALNSPFLLSNPITSDE